MATRVVAAAPRKAWLQVCRGASLSAGKRRTQPLTPSRTHAHSHTLTCALTRSLAHTHSHTLTRSLTHAHMVSHLQTRVHSHSHTYTLLTHTLRTCSHTAHSSCHTHIGDNAETPEAPSQPHPYWVLVSVRGRGDGRGLSRETHIDSPAGSKR